MNSATATSARLTEQRPFVLFWLARLASTMGYQMLAITIGWQIYELTNSAFDLGLVGLIQIRPGGRADPSDRSCGRPIRPQTDRTCRAQHLRSRRAADHGDICNRDAQP